MKKLFEKLTTICQQPNLYECSTLPLLWNDSYISEKMLEAHLNENTNSASRNKAFLDKSIEWIISRFNINENSKICDYGCGPGVYTTRFAEYGARVRGIDLSERSIEYARKVSFQKNLKIDYICQDYLNFFNDTVFDIATMIFCDFCALSTDQQKVILRKLYESLGTNGLLIFDVYSQNHFASINEGSQYDHVLEKGFWSSKPYFLFHHTFKYKEEKVLLDKYTIIEEEQTREIYNWIKCFDVHSIRTLLQENGFRIIDFYSNVCGEEYLSSSNEIGIVARKT